jgi:uncharacterized membrane protein
MQKFDGGFRSELIKKVEAVEAGSGVELVVALFPKAKSYAAYYWAAAACSGLLVLTLLMFLPHEFWYVLIYFETLGTAILAAGLLLLLPGLLRNLVGSKRLQANAKERAKLTFQKAGIYETKERIGVLFCICWFEQRVEVLADKGAAALIPADELEKLELGLNGIFDQSDAAQALLEQLDIAAKVFAQYVSRAIHPVNELPDGLWLD